MRHPGVTFRSRTVRSLAIVVCVVIVMASVACSGKSTPDAVETSGASGTTIPQPDVGTLQVAPEGERVDIAMPSFSDPTAITNPLFPVVRQRSVLLLGKVDGKAFRTEVSLLPETRIIEWGGQHIEAAVSQYVAFLDGRIHEVAYDFYAQADDGSVWYLGEDVFNFGDGVIVDTHGTWIAGKDGPGAMIMPADPKVGDTYRPENIPGFVFEEVTVTQVDETVDGPMGQVDGALIIRELHMDGTTEDKTFAPGYGEFYTSGGGDTEALAMSANADAATLPPPDELAILQSAASDVFEASTSGDWGPASTAARTLTDAWKTYPREEVPRLVAPVMSRSMVGLSTAVAARDAMGARQAAIDVLQSALDLQLRYSAPVEVDRARFQLWADQLQLDAEAGDAPSVNGDYFTLDYLRDRILEGMDAEEQAHVNSRLEELQGAVGDGELQAAARSAARL